MKNFTYYNPVKYIFGKNVIAKTGTEIKAFGVEKVLLLYGGGSIFKNGVYEKVTDSLKENGIGFVELGGVKPNPVLSKVNEAVEVCRAEKVDGILAVGGGSVLDPAKVIASGVFYDGDIWDVFERKAPAPNKALPVFSVLTISATGSEANPFAVITNEKENKKWAFSAGALSFPKVSIVDPQVQITLPREQTLFGAIDMMAHIFEFYFENKETGTVADEILEGLLRGIINAVQVAVEKPGDIFARENLALAGTMALSGLHISATGNGDWASHAIEHSLSAFYDIPHGAGLAIVFPAWMKYVYKNNLSKFIRYAEKVWDVREGSDEEKALRGIAKTKEFFKRLGAPVSLKDAGIEFSEIEKLARNAAMLAPLGSLVKLEYGDIVEILKLAAE